MAPDTELLRDIGFIILGLALFAFSSQSNILLIISYILIAYGVVHTLFRINLDKVGRRL